MKKTNKRKRHEVEITLELETYKFLVEVSKLSKVSKNDVINVILATQLLKWEKEKQARDFSKEEE